MTANQIAYQNLLETKRSNVAKEAETKRHNISDEYNRKLRAFGTAALPYHLLLNGTDDIQTMVSNLEDFRSLLQERYPNLSLLFSSIPDGRTAVKDSFEDLVQAFENSNAGKTTQKALEKAISTFIPGGINVGKHNPIFPTSLFK